MRLRSKASGGLMRPEPLDAAQVIARGEERHAEYDSDMNRLIALAKRAPPACSSIKRPTFARLAGSSGAGCRARAGGDGVGEPLRAAHLGWGLSRPATEGVGERARLLEPKQ